ncbi:unnamed protein product [Nippostrongylus brasiliensis]|uniref:EGF-like domain-containing protein n=1 Tax=Nippostrongylus brasiliensis TaxID=27835 RepID=A0A0N4YXI6_NIPBR|nr:unnamed protein product [Nippostrongylus brasiliensis]
MASSAPVELAKTTYGVAEGMTVGTTQEGLEQSADQAEATGTAQTTDTTVNHLENPISTAKDSAESTRGNTAVYGYGTSPNKASTVTSTSYAETYASTGILSTLLNREKASTTSGQLESGNDQSTKPSEELSDPTLRRTVSPPEPVAVPSSTSTSVQPSFDTTTPKDSETFRHYRHPHATLLSNDLRLPNRRLIKTWTDLPLNRRKVNPKSGLLPILRYNRPQEAFHLCAVEGGSDMADEVDLRDPQVRQLLRNVSEIDGAETRFFVNERDSKLYMKEKKVRVVSLRWSTRFFLNVNETVAPRQYVENMTAACKRPKDRKLAFLKKQRIRKSCKECFPYGTQKCERVPEGFVCRCRTNWTDPQTFYQNCRCFFVALAGLFAFLFRHPALLQIVQIQCMFSSFVMTCSFLFGGLRQRFSCKASLLEFRKAINSVRIPDRLSKLNSS